MAAWDDRKTWRAREAVQRKMSTMSHFVCDRCGNYWTAYRSQTCPACKGTALWQFDREQPAREHAAQIKGPHKSVKPL